MSQQRVDPSVLDSLMRRVSAIREHSPYSPYSPESTESTESADTDRRTLIGIVGAPGAGKSTLAAAVVRELQRSGVQAVLVGMDGFHLAQQLLDEAGTAPIKGAPETFDPDGFVALLERLREVPRQCVYAPTFDRALEQPIAGAVRVEPADDVVVTEGNYLLLDEPPWRSIRMLLDETWYLDVPEADRVERLVRRHMRYGRSRAAAHERATTGVDGINARLVAGSRKHANLVIPG